MNNPYLCVPCLEDGITTPAVLLIHFQEEGGSRSECAVCESCFLHYPPNDYSYIENLTLCSDKMKGEVDLS